MDATSMSVEDAHSKSESVEKRDYSLLLIDRTGSGRIFQFDLNTTQDPATSWIPSNQHSHQAIWPPIVNLVDFAVAQCQNKVYCIGGFHVRHKIVLSSVMCFNTSSGEWKETATMFHRRLGSFAVSINDSQILVGGGWKTKAQMTSSCEMYSCATNSWTICADLPAPRASLAACVSNRTIFVSGGEHFSARVNCTTGSEQVWCYDIDADTWSEIDTECPHYLSKPVSRHSMVALENSVYFLGGLKSMVRDCGTTEVVYQVTEPLAESYQTEVAFRDEKENVVSKWPHWITAWNHALPPPHTARHNAAAAVLNKHWIFLFGGTNLAQAQEHPNGIHRVEMFDARQSSWSTCFYLPNEYDVRNLSAIVLQSPAQLVRKMDSSLTKSYWQMKWVLW